MGHQVEETTLRGYDHRKAYSHIRGIFGMGHLATLRQAALMKGSEPSGEDFTRFMFEDGNMLVAEDFSAPDVDRRLAAPVNLVVPLYHKIRIPLRQVVAAHRPSFNRDNAFDP